MIEILTEDEVQAIIMAVLDDGEAHEEAEMERCVEWAKDTRVNAAVLQLVLDGKLIVGVKDGKIAFNGKKNTACTCGGGECVCGK